MAPLERPTPAGLFFDTPQTSLRRMLAGERLRIRNPKFNVRSLRQIAQDLADFLR